MPLHEALLDWDGIGPSGEQAVAVDGETLPPGSTTQWTGCEGEAAWGRYDAEGRTRLTAELRARAFAPAGLRSTVRVVVDDEVVEEFDLGARTIAVDVDLPDGDELRLEAVKTAGECTAAPQGYILWEDGTLH